MEKARQFPALPVAVVDAQERHVLEGVLAAYDAGFIEPILIGQLDSIQALCHELGCNPERFVVIDSASDTESANAGVELVSEGKASTLIKGWIHTDVLMRVVLARLRTTRRISHAFITELDHYHKLLYITDAACPSKMAQRGQIKGAIVDGPLAFDNAISSDAARTKQIISEVAGDADILLAPDLDAGNILAKDLEYLAGASIAGIVIGAQAPIMLPSRSDPPAARLASATIAVLIHQLWPDSK